MTGQMTAVIALGGCEHGDDAAALLVADILRQRLPDLVTVLEAPTAAEDLAGVWGRHDTVFLVDAVSTGAEPGAVHRLDPTAEALPPGHGRRTDDLSLDDIVATMPRQRRTDRGIVVIGIEGRWFTPEAGVSPEVAAAAHEVSELIADTVQTARPGAGGRTRPRPEAETRAAS